MYERLSCQPEELWGSTETLRRSHLREGRQVTGVWTCLSALFLLLAAVSRTALSGCMFPTTLIYYLLLQVQSAGAEWACVKQKETNKQNLKLGAQLIFPS